MAAVSKILFIGCGGSGGMTLRIAMDSLRNELRRMNEANIRAGLESIEFGSSGLPACWKFLHIDVPAEPDGQGDDLPPSVPDMGGRYVPLAMPGVTYQAVCNDLLRLTAGKSSVKEIEGWLKEPGLGDPILASGAGQMRAVGRAVTLSATPRIHSALTAAADSLVAAESDQDLARLRHMYGQDNVGMMPQPLVFMVSSMAGGAGASMVLDVARLMSRVRPAWIESTCLFLYTSEVFSKLDEGLRRGVEGNGLAALGELLATCMGATSQEGQLIADMGLPGQNYPQTFGRVIPIGNKQGTQAALFGDGSLDTLYRSIGRGLAGLVASPVALSEFAQYDLTNVGSVRTTKLEWLGHGLEAQQPVLWGNFGYGRLSLGRDKYAEYFAQRLARQAVDVLCGDETSEGITDADRQSQAQAAFTHLLASHLGLPRPGEPLGVLELLGRTNPDSSKTRSDVHAIATEILRQQVYSDQHLARSQPGTDFKQTLEFVMRSQSEGAMRETRDIAYAMAFGLLRDLVRDVRTGIESIAATQGLAVARSVALHLKSASLEWSSSLISQSRSWSPDGATVLPPAPKAEMDFAASLQTFGADDPVRRRLLNKHAGGLSNVMAGYMAGLLGEALKEFGDKFANPLAEALGALNTSLAEMRSASARAAGSSDPRTSQYAHWPTDGQAVPARFRGAHNEVILADPNEFPGQFETHAGEIGRIRGAASEREAMQTVLKEILSDRWRGHNDENSEAQVIDFNTVWVPRSLTSDPEKPASVRVPAKADFDLKWTPIDVLARAREWVNRPDGELADYLRIGLREFVEDEVDVNVLAEKFQLLLNHARPLVQVDSTIFQQLHPGTAELELDYKFSAIPLQNVSNRADERLRAVLADIPYVKSGSEGNRFMDALDTDPTIDHIDVFGSYSPLSPLVISSLLRPLSEAIAGANAHEGIVDLWRNRRARPLPGCLPLTPADRRAMIGGYLVGKMTGRLRGTYREATYDPGSTIDVYSETDGWLSFPKPFLTPVRDDFDWDECAALLETQLVAIAQCGTDSNMTSLRAFLALRLLYGAPQEYSPDSPFDVTHGARRFVQEFIASGPLGGDVKASTLSRNYDLTTDADRREAVLKYLDALNGSIKLPKASRYNVRPMLPSLVDDFALVIEELRELAALVDDAHKHGPVF